MSSSISHHNQLERDRLFTLNIFIFHSIHSLNFQLKKSSDDDDDDEIFLILILDIANTHENTKERKSERKHINKRVQIFDVYKHASKENQL